MKIGYLLSGCGFLDGAEIQEAVSGLIALQQAGATVIPIAPDVAQHHVVDHQKGEPQDGSRQVLIESARIVRGNVTACKDIDADAMDALVIAGGFGVAKNLCDLAFKGPDCQVEPSVVKLIEGVYAARKPIGAMCIAPALVAKVLGPKANVKLTIGKDADTAGAIQAMGCTHVECDVHSIIVDETHKVVSTPAYMLGPGPADVFEGISKLCKEVVKLAS